MDERGAKGAEEGVLDTAREIASRSRSSRARAAARSSPSVAIQAVLSDPSFPCISNDEPTFTISLLACVSVVAVLCCISVFIFFTGVKVASFRFEGL